MPSMQTFLDSIADFWALQSVALLGFCAAVTDAYNVGVLLSWYHSIDMDCTLFHVKF
jgi:hypothetical protein